MFSVSRNLVWIVITSTTDYFAGSFIFLVHWNVSLFCPHIYDGRSLRWSNGSGNLPPPLQTNQSIKVNFSVFPSSSSSFPFAVRRRVPTTTIFYILSYPGPVGSPLVAFFLFYVPVLPHIPPILIQVLLLVLPPVPIFVFFPNPSLLRVYNISTFSFPPIFLLIQRLSKKLKVYMT
jgi:hypothetical protein